MVTVYGVDDERVAGHRNAGHIQYVRINDSKINLNFKLKIGLILSYLILSESSVHQEHMCVKHDLSAYAL